MRCCYYTLEKIMAKSWPKCNTVRIHDVCLLTLRSDLIKDVTVTFVLKSFMSDDIKGILRNISLRSGLALSKDLQLKMDTYLP